MEGGEERRRGGGVIVLERCSSKLSTLIRSLFFSAIFFAATLHSMYQHL